MVSMVIWGQDSCPDTFYSFAECTCSREDNSKVAGGGRKLDIEIIDLDKQCWHKKAGVNYHNNKKPQKKCF